MGVLVCALLCYLILTQCEELDLVRAKNGNVIPYFELSRSFLSRMWLKLEVLLLIVLYNDTSS